jgi:flagellar hook-associated protein 2
MAGVNFSGFNGFDFGQLIDLTIQAESKPLAEIQKQEKSIRDKDSAFSTLAGLISKLQTSVNSLNSTTIFTNVSAASSDTGIATTSVGSGAIAGKYDLSITQLAKGQVTSSANGYSATSDVVATGGSISFTIDGETTTAIQITEDTTLAELKDAINNQGSGVVASVVNDGTNYKLVISSRNTGEDNGFIVNNSLTNSPGTVVSFAPGQNATTGNAQNAQDAEFSVNGLDITSGSNTVTDAVPGISVTLIKAGTVSVNVSADYDTLKETLKTLVTDYNKLREFYNAQAKVDPLTGKAGVLGNDTVLRQALRDIRSTVLESNSNGGRYSYLAEIGLEFTQTGDLKFDETKFNTALDSYPEDLQKLLQGTDVVSGVFDTLKTRLDNLDGTTGLIKTTRNSLDVSLKSYRDRIVAQELRLEIRRQALTKMYAAADQAMTRLNSYTGQLQAIGGR